MERETGSIVETLIAPPIEAMGYAVVRVRFSGKRPPVLQVMVERADDAPMTVDDCADISRAVSAVLDVADPLAGPYSLEISSPGIDRPLVRPRDYDRFAGHEAKLETGEAIDGRKRFRGRLMGFEDTAVQIDIGGADGVVAIPFAAIRSARLVLTDALIAAAGGAATGERQC